MIRHIVMWGLKENNPTNRISVKEKLMDLNGKIPELKFIDVVFNDAEAPQTNSDVMLITDFENMDGLNAYQKHPAHLEVAGYIKTMVATRACVDYRY